MASIVRSVRNTERLARIVLVLVKHGFGEVVSRLPLGPLSAKARGPEEAPRNLALRLREAMQELGPTFVKLGQVMSTRPDVLPADVIAELKKLQDHVEPMSSDEVDEVLAEAYADLDAVFSHFERKPLASASIGQVHLATLRGKDGAPDTDVVVKLQRPAARSLVERDLDLLYLLARLLAENVPESRIYAPVAMVTEFDRAITAELDYGLEAEHALRFQRNFASDPTVKFPTPYREASGKRTLVMERFKGQHIDEIVAAGGEGTGPRIAKRALLIIAKMIFEHGFFHADPHPGNIIMLGTAADPVVGMIDLGLVGRLSEDMRDKAISLMLAVATGDSDGLADTALSMGKPGGRVDLSAFRADVAIIAEKYLGRSLKEIEVSAVVRDMVECATKHDIEMPSELMMMGKALMTVEGVGKQLDPDLDVVNELRPYLTEIVMQRYSPQRIGRDLLRGARQLSSAATTLPGQIHDVLEDLRSGRLTVIASDPDRVAATDRLGRRLFSGVVIASLVGSGTALLAVDQHTTFALMLYAMATMFGFAHAATDWWRNRKRRSARR